MTIILDRATVLQIMTNAEDVIDLYIDPLNQSLQQFDISNEQRVAAYLAQLAHESGELHAKRENLNYSANALMANWPKRFNAANVNNYARNPIKIANYVYANRMGNGNEASGDGYRYRGGGGIQLTGKENYTLFGNAIGIDLVNNPEQIEDPLIGTLAAGWFWQTHGCNELADNGDFIAITKHINGGTIGLEDRQKYYALAQDVQFELA